MPSWICCRRGQTSSFRQWLIDRAGSIVAQEVLATGHFRSGILLAPITAEAIAELVATGRSAIDLAPFSVTRFAP